MTIVPSENDPYFLRKISLGEMWDIAARTLSVSSVSNVQATDIYSVCYIFYKKTHSTEPSALCTDWQVVWCVKNMSQTCQI